MIDEAAVLWHFTLKSKSILVWIILKQEMFRLFQDTVREQLINTGHKKNWLMKTHWGLCSKRQGRPDWSTGQLTTSKEHVLWRGCGKCIGQKNKESVAISAIVQGLTDKCENNSWTDNLKPLSHIGAKSFKIPEPISCSDWIKSVTWA